MSEEDIRSKSSKEPPGGDRADQPSGQSFGFTEPHRNTLIDLIRAANRDSKCTDVSDFYENVFLQTLSIIGEPFSVETKNPANQAKASDLSLELMDMPREGITFLAISANKFKELRDRTAEILQEAALAYKKIAKDQQEIEQLKTETREMLAKLRAA